jgi:hypothetical protein
MKLINLTPHVINIHASGQIIVISPSGVIARLMVERISLPSVEVDGITIPIASTILGDLVDMPPPTEGVWYVASALVAQKCTQLNREDTFSPGELIRNDNGFVIGCNGLCIYL